MWNFHGKTNYTIAFKCVAKRRKKIIIWIRNFREKILNKGRRKQRTEEISRNEKIQQMEIWEKMIGGGFWRQKIHKSRFFKEIYTPSPFLGCFFFWSTYSLYIFFGFFSFEVCTSFPFFGLFSFEVRKPSNFLGPNTKHIRKEKHSSF